MSLLEQLRTRKQRLKPTNTIVTHLDGQRFLEKQGLITGKIQDQTFGFVVDNTPDNVPAKITDYIYLGSQDSCELEALNKFNIKNVLSIGIESPCQFANVNYKFVQCLDQPETNIIDILENECIHFMQHCVDNCENILVHCNAGVSRSSSVVIGYLMNLNQITYEIAYTFVRSKRKCIKPNIGFEKQLIHWEKGTILNK